MHNINFQNSDWLRLRTFSEAYYRYLGWQNDGFHNTMMFEAVPYEIVLNKKTFGFFSPADGWDGGKMLTSFYMNPEGRIASDKVFDLIIEEYEVTASLVPSNDSNYICLAFEKMKSMGTIFEIQAYNFVYGAAERPAEFGMNLLSEVLPDEYELMNKLTEGQWEGCYGDPNYSFYAVRENGITFGYGAIGRMRYTERYVDIGNFTIPEYRRKGVGRSLIINLSSIAVSRGFIPVAGCWYGNKESIATLKSSGYIPENRIFYVKYI